jgi:glucose-1-phosphate adenylyltransferase
MCSMGRVRTLAVIQAGGAGGRMDVLTRERAKPALPFAGIYQLVDFPLSNLSHSGITDVWLSVQYQGATMEDEVANGRPWDLDRNRGGLRLLMPEQGSGGADEDGFATGNGDQLYRIRDQITALSPEVVVVVSADHVYRFDFGELVDLHLRTEAECTLVVTDVAVEDASDHLVVTTDGDRVRQVDLNPERAPHGTVGTEIFAYRPDVLVEVLEELHRELGPDSDTGDTGIGDFGEHLVPRLVERGKVRAMPIGGYWRDVGQPHYYLRAHREMLADDAGVLNVPGWPILTRHTQRGPARLMEGSSLHDSLVSSGCHVAGHVERSVLGPGVVVRSGARVVDSVIFSDTVVAEGATVTGAIVDDHCEIGEGATIGGPDADLDDPDQIILVGRESSVAAGVRLEPGARVEPGSTV